MDLMESEDMGGGCEEKNCGPPSAFLEDCSSQDCDWDQPVFGFTELVGVTIIYIPLLLFGLLGNVLTILVVWLRPHMRSSSYLYLSSMAVSDLMILLLLPLDLYKLWKPRPWPFGDLACKMTMFLSECCTFCTILHITFLSLERYVAVCWPMTAKTLVTRRRTRALIGCLWLGAAVSAAPVLVMVGVEEVGREDLGLGGWRENARWMGEDAEPLGFAPAADEGGRPSSSFEGEGEEQKWGERERVRELKLFDAEEEGMETVGEPNKKDAGEIGNETQEMKEDEGGGWEASVAAHAADSRECRCTQYAISSGLLSTMMIVSNLYFLVPVCILGLVYGMIGRTLWLRPQSSRREQSHRHAVKMLGVIVMAFVLCWLPFHIGRTIFVFSLGTGADQQNLDTAESIDDVGAVTKDVRADTPVNSKLPYSYEPPTGSQQTAQGSRQSARLSSLAVAAASAHATSRALDAASPSRETRQRSRGSRAATPAGQSNDTHLAKEPRSDSPLYFLYYLSQYFNLGSSVLYYLSAAVNPLLYNVMSARYRHAVRDLLRARSQRRDQHLRTLETRRATLNMRAECAACPRPTHLTHGPHSTRFCAYCIACWTHR